jgi:uncharacterized Zn-binding protein involved in type VI secretion
MGKPAARLGDMTAHGGAIVVGFPLVLIGGMPAARVSDMHVCPMVTVLVPHVGGPVLPPGSPTVLIGGMPAARMGDMAVCVGPPDAIILGCVTVLIGESGTGSGGGGAGSGAANDARISASTATPPGPKTTDPTHWIRFDFVDKSDTPISGVPYDFTAPDGVESEGSLDSNGRVYWSGATTGQGRVVLKDVSNAKWSQQSANVGDVIMMKADVSGYTPGTNATFDIYKRYNVGADEFIETVTAQTQSDKVEAEWQYVYVPGARYNLGSVESIGYSIPKYYFIVKVESQQVRSDLLELWDWIEIELKDIDLAPVANAEFILSLPNGEVRRGNLDPNGFKREDRIPPGTCRIRFPERENIVPD